MAKRPPRIRKKKAVKRYCFPIILWSKDQMYLWKKSFGSWWMPSACISCSVISRSLNGVILAVEFVPNLRPFTFPGPELVLDGLFHPPVIGFGGFHHDITDHAVVAQAAKLRASDLNGMLDIFDLIHGHVLDL